MHHFADDDFVKLINEQFNQGQIKQSLCFFTSSKKQFDNDMKIELNGIRLYETDSVKYFGIWRQGSGKLGLKTTGLSCGYKTYVQYLNPIYAMLHLFGLKTLI